MVDAAYKYAEDPKAGLLANANTGGENVARGAVLGAVYGAGLGMKVFLWHIDLFSPMYSDVESLFQYFCWFK
jgi:hypothetical protein